jgi:DNA-binding transcriptional LysR family regulator
MDEKDYEILLELYEAKNITKVSQKLFLSQPALTKRLIKMEDELNCNLLVRSKKGVIFTPIGESIISYIRTIYKTTAEMKNHVNINQGFIGGTLNMGCSVNFSHYRLPAVLKTYTQLYPLVNINITTNQSKNLYRMLLKDEISIAIVRGDFRWDEGKKLLFKEPMQLVCSEENAHKSLDSYPYINRSTDASLSLELHKWLEENNLPGNTSKICLDNLICCMQMVQNGIGWCILPQICLDNFEGHTEKLYFKDGSPFERNTYVLYKNSYYELPQVQLFINHLTDSCLLQNSF